MKLAVVGWRNFENYNIFRVSIINYLQKQYLDGHICSAIISGGCRGTDTMAKRFSQEEQLEYIEFPADWARFGKSAGLMRNTEIVKECTHLLAFPESMSSQNSGTWDSIHKAQKANKYVKIYSCEEILKTRK